MACGITYIYGLECPVFNRMMYIGKAINPDKRYMEHVRANDYSKNARWLGWLRAQGKKPRMVIIEVCIGDKFWSRERYWINYFRSHGYNLTNSVHGYDDWDTHRQKIDDAYKAAVVIGRTKDRCAKMFELLDLPDYQHLLVKVYDPTESTRAN